MRVERDIAIDASREEAWDLVSEPDNYSRFWHGLTRLDRKNDEHGCGARFAMRMRVGSADIGGLIEIVEFDEPADMAWHSITGIDHRVRWLGLTLSGRATSNRAGRGSARFTVKRSGSGSAVRKVRCPRAGPSSLASSQTSTRSPWRRAVAWSRPRLVSVNVRRSALTALMPTAKAALSRDHLKRATPTAPASWISTR